jgi:hypothetical protein
MAYGAQKLVRRLSALCEQARNLRQILTSYACYYNDSRTHLSLHKHTPLGRAVQRYGNIAATPVLSGLHHRYAGI